MRERFNRHAWSPKTATRHLRRESEDTFYYIYILKSLKDNKLYIGKTKNLKKRFKKHATGRVPATKNRRPLKLVYYEAYTNKKSWSKQELFYKSGIGREALKHKI